MPLDRDLLARAKAALTKKAVEGEDDKKPKKPQRAPAFRDVPEYIQTPATQDQTQQQAAAPKKKEELTPEQPWSKDKLLQFARMGLNPQRLMFMQSLAALRKGMNLESELLDRALRGQISRFGGEEDVMPLSQFA